MTIIEKLEKCLNAPQGSATESETEKTIRCTIKYLKLLSKCHKYLEMIHDSHHGDCKPYFITEKTQELLDEIDQTLNTKGDIGFDILEQ